MLEVKSLTVGYAKTVAPVIEDVNFSLARGEIGCLLGPSGCGKTTVLRTIAGFEKPRQGSILVNHEVVSDPKRCKPVAQRQIGMVFQDFALFPHLTVAQNIAFGLRHLDTTARAARVEECLALVNLTSHAQNFPHQLSGGQQQRVALARALAPEPEVILFDEPFSSLDTRLREQLAGEIRRLLKQVNTTAIIVTHDHHEAFAIADKIAVLEGGKMHQWGTAYELYHEPSTSFVARFIGEGVFLQAILSEGGFIHTAIGDFNASEAYFCEGSQHRNVGEQLQLLVRPDDILHDDSSPFKALVVNRIFRGAHILYTLELLTETNRDKPVPAQRVLCLAPSHHDHNVGEYFGIRLALEHMMLFPNN
ncbi:ABC transporter ATP-binding protein [Alteromonas oceanisediminis]|uniref:ABC transporter ATP-binding protein n=1 Tax=Alteromonas oceanisediminis TaxID=2836180 RepID=UPI001BDA04F1|nr:ABC transporter ATP-binding protein [Alteromonas oceanisediminis]MBT0587549.1 ABC transporter ATP-binding protein [Alteromonas oceanisediminis]